jgi:dTDP-4-dehydrorhamnose 3,5-epimerase
VIEGVWGRAFVPHADDRGSLTEALRAHWPEFERFGQAFVTVNLPGVVRGWHWHERQTDVTVSIAGVVLLPLYDGRPTSWTRSQVDRYVPGEFPPRGVPNGHKTLGPDAAIIQNFPSVKNDLEHPDEHHLPHDDPAIPVDWSARA